MPTNAAFGIITLIVVTLYFGYRFARGLNSETVDSPWGELLYALFDGIFFLMSYWIVKSFGLREWPSPTALILAGLLAGSPIGLMIYLRRIIKQERERSRREKLQQQIARWRVKQAAQAEQAQARRIEEQEARGRAELERRYQHMREGETPEDR